METVYDPKPIETHWSKAWETLGVGKPTGCGSPYAIILPPPNVTGSLHMGHGFQQTLMDVLIRTHRMKGRNTLWQVGTDHAGIATQMVVERQLAANSQSRHDLGRDAFVDKVWEWKETSGNTITHQIRRLGATVDWSSERFSMDEHLTAAVKKVFIDLYKEGLIYRGKKLVNWDPKFHTAISDLEVINKEQQGSLWHIRYPIVGSVETLIVATTRPETLLGDTAVAVHPDDERYQHLIGGAVKLPLTDREIPIIADEYVEKDFGSGCVKITPAHDFNDNDIGHRHNLDVINIMTIDGYLNDEVPTPYRGMERFSARKQIVADLESEGFLDKIEPHTLQVPYGDRSDVVIEPMLTDQWFVKATDMAEPAIQAVTSGEMTFVPDNWKNTYMQWMNNIQDWCISRQLWWGHRIPAWYDEQNNIYVGQDEADVRQTHQLPDTIVLRQDDDVLDTWFSASLWPFATQGWPDQTDSLKQFYPSAVLMTGFDIIFFWVARMVMMGKHFMGKAPFKEVYITGLIRDAHGHKMSKSKGNVLDPLDLIDGITLEALIDKRTRSMMQPHLADKIKKNTMKDYPDGIPAFGTDALRFTFCALANTGRNINFDLGRIEGYRNFCNKLWNASRFVLMQTENHTISQPSTDTLGLTDRWIMDAFSNMVEKVASALAQYRFDLMATAIYEFTWNDYCGWYLEFTKSNQTDASRYTLLTVLEHLLRLMHPIMPFITEALWAEVAPRLALTGDTISTQPYPEKDNFSRDTTAHTTITFLQQLITSVRTIRAEMNISPKVAVSLICRAQAKDNTEDYQSRITPIVSLWQHLANISEITWQTELPPSATDVVDGLELHIPMEGLIDTSAEAERLQKEIKKLRDELQKIDKKLGNKNYTDKAPADIVKATQDKQATITRTIETLEGQWRVIEALNQ